MNIWEKVTRSNFLIRLRNWEYWPFGIIQFPAMVYWLWLSCRARSLVFFSASNPGIPMGGMLGESKYHVLRNIPQQYVPTTLFIEPPVTASSVSARMAAAGLKLPVIFKPDLGERGYMVKKIGTTDEIDQYLRNMNASFLIQEWISLPLEYGVFFIKFPDEVKGKVISLVAKEMLSVTGDGKATLQELILGKDRAKLQWKKLRIMYRERLNAVIPAGQKMELVSIGNHAQGARFINANHLINERLSENFDSIGRSVPGFYFGRFDVRCSSLEDLYEGNVKIMELNGCGAEPGHIYDEDFPLWEAFRAPVVYWKYIFMISRANREKGVDYISFREALAHYRKFKSCVI
jgi:hypothetical protein